MKLAICMMCATILAACASKDSGVRVTEDAQKPQAMPEAKVTQPIRKEPIFYNGKTYQLQFAPTQGGNFAMSVHGMTAKQQKDATAVATSSLRYFKCKDGLNGILTSGPTYADAAWKMTAKCG